MSTTIDPCSVSFSDVDGANPTTPANSSEELLPEAPSQPILGHETEAREDTVRISPSPRVLEALRRI